MKKQDWKEAVKEAITDALGIIAWILMAIVFISIISCVTSCASSRKTIDSDIESGSSSTMNINARRLQDTHTFDISTLFQRVAINGRYNVVIYDTSKPVDQTTGRPPVASEITSDFKASNETTETDSIHQATVDADELNLWTDSTENHVEHVESSEDKGSAKFGYIWIYISSALLIISGIVIKLGYDYFRKLDRKAY